MQDISIWFAIMAGVLSFFSPCVFPLLPAYITHLTGGTIEDQKMILERKVLVIRSIGFIIGFSIIFILLGASASFVGQFFSNYRVLVTQISGILIVVFGLQMMGLLKLKILMYEKRVKGEQKPKGFFSSVFLGFAFASGWTPCVGLVLSSILLLAGSSETVNQGMILLSAYSLGMGIPFLIISILLSYSLKLLKKLNKHLAKLSVINGTIMVILGILVFTGQMQVISAWLAKYSLFTF